MAEEKDQEKQIKDKCVPGTHFSHNGVCEINKDQKELEVMREELDLKMKNVQSTFDKEMRIEDKKIFTTKLKDEDLGDLVIQSQQADFSSHQNAQVIEKLKHVLKKPMTVPIELTNILQADLE